MTDNKPYLEACSARIADAILAFCAENAGRTFVADDLRRYVAKATGNAAPASADRVLRDLRQSGRVNYTVISRANSLYRLEPTATKETATP